MRRVATAAVAVGLAVMPQTAVAQVLRGRITDHASGAVVSGVQIALLDDRGREAAPIASDSAGLFEVGLPRSGTYRVRASAFGYQTFISEPLSFESGEIVEMLLQLSVEPISLTPIVVRVKPYGARLADFERRRLRHESGYFVTRRDIERRPIATASELLIAVPGVALVPRTLYGIRQDRYRIMLRGHSGPCTADVFINGAPVSQDAQSTIDDFLNPDWLGGVEVYPTAESVPVEYRTSDGCGVVLFWTREPEGGRPWHWFKLVVVAGFVGAAALLTR